MDINEKDTAKGYESGTEYYTDEKPDEDKVFFDDTEFTGQEKTKEYRSGVFSIAVFVISILSVFTVFTKSVPIVIGACVFSLILCIIAVARRHEERGFAIGGLIISALMLIVFSWNFFIASDSLLEEVFGISSHNTEILQDIEGGV